MELQQNNENFVLPKVFLIGCTTINIIEIAHYLEYTGQTEFLQDIQAAEEEGLNPGEILCSFYAKGCYASLTTKKNKNISKVRSIFENIVNTIESQHGSVFEHCNLNFMITNCSRVFTHELVRHRVGTAFSQTSGRYVRNDILKVVIDPILEEVYEDIETVRKSIEIAYKLIEGKLSLNNFELNFDRKKKLTSALRRIMPNGQSNEIGFSVNIRTLRQTIEARTSRHAEWEIRFVFNQIYNLVKEKYSAIFLDAKEEIIDNQIEVTFKNKKI